MTTTETDYDVESFITAGERRAAAEKALHAAFIEMKAAKADLKRLLVDGVENHGLGKAEAARIIGVGRQSIYNLLAWGEDEKG